jgi:hypothetical protein
MSEQTFLFFATKKANAHEFIHDIEFSFLVPRKEKEINTKDLYLEKSFLSFIGSLKMWPVVSTACSENIRSRDGGGGIMGYGWMTRQQRIK